MSGGALSAIRPLIDYVDPVEIVLGEYLPIDSLATHDQILAQILVSSVWTDQDESGFTLGAEFFLGKLGTLCLPGLEQLKLSFNDDSMAKGILFCGEESYLQLEDVETTLRIAPEILRDAHGNGATISANCGLRFDSTGFHFLAFTDASLNDARIAGTDIALTLNGIHFDPSSKDFLSVRSGSISLPLLLDSAGNPLVLQGQKISIGLDGPSGVFERMPGAPLPLTIHGFACEIDDARISLDHGQLVDVALGGRIDLGKFLAPGRDSGWVGIAFSIGPDGLVAALSRDEPIIDMKVENLLDLAVDAIRLDGAGQGGDGTLWLSGNMTPRVSGVNGNWPTLAFDEIGIGPNGGLRLAKGATVATTQPFVLSWNFLKLIVTAFSLQRPLDAPDDLELRISAAVDIISGMPAGASVDGLVARWKSTGGVDVSFNGIGLKYGTPGGFAFAASISWDETRHALSGAGHLDIPSIDMRLDVVVEAARENGINTFFLAAEADLVPGGIPIGTTGLSLYAVSGLLAYNLALDLPHTGPRRFFDAFMAAPAGSFAARRKWVTSAGANALGLGVVIGTADDGWLFSARGALMVTFPDLAILLTATGELLKERQPLNETGEGKLAALLAVYPAEQLLRLDFTAQWSSPPLFEVQGSGGGEFRGDKPFDFKVWLGQRPSIGAPVSARAIKLGSQWLINSEFWFGLDAKRQADIGIRSSIELKAGSGGLYAEIVASAGGEAILAWRPSQFEGSLALRGRARLVAGGLSLGISLSAGFNLQLDRPRRLEIPLRACIEIDLGFTSFEICLAFTFLWRNEQAPDLPAFIHGLATVPRFWEPRPHLGTDTPIENGISHHLSEVNFGSFDLGMVPPHSELVLEFSKSMCVSPAVTAAAALNDVATPFPQKIGSTSGWLAKWTLEKIDLLDVSTGRPVDLFGTFSRSPLTNTDKNYTPRPPNTELRLLSSRRFGSDGSLGGGGAENSSPIDCTPKPTIVTKCIELKDLQVGYGFLANGWLYHWKPERNAGRARDNRYGVGMALGDIFDIWIPEGIDKVTVAMADYVPKQPPVPGTQKKQTFPNPSPEPLRFYGENRKMLLELCWDELVADVGQGHQDWKGSSGKEEWNVDPEIRLLIPGHRYQLDLQMSGQLQRGSGNSGAPAAYHRTYTFTADRAPDWLNGLGRAIDARYPDDGVRPIYRDYDLVVLFKDTFFNALYKLDKRRLGVRLRNSDGELVSTADGGVLLPTQWELGKAKRSPVEEWWLESRRDDQAHPCEVDVPEPEQGETCFPIALKDLNLRPQMRYFAELVAVDEGPDRANATPPLVSWSFTTSRFKTFTDMFTPLPSSTPIGVAQLYPPVSQRFEDLAKAFTIPVIHLPLEASATPMWIGNRLVYLLIETPEPMDDEAGRLSIKIDGVLLAKPPVFNLDKTRLIVELPTPVVLTDPDHKVDLSLTWAAEPKDAPRHLRRTIAGKAGDETIGWQISLGGLF